MKRYYMAITVDYTGMKEYYKPEEDTNTPKYCAWVESVTESDNLLSALDFIGGLKTVNLFPTKKRAEEVADFWNECYKKNGTYALA